MSEKVKAEGYSKGDVWDDGSDHDEVSVIYVRGGSGGIQYIITDYLKTGQTKEGSYNIDMWGAFPWTFEIDHKKGEHLLSVEGYYGYDNIQALQFKTNLRSSELRGYTRNCSKFTLESEGKKIIGFHGTFNTYLYSLGAYVTDITPTRVEAKGGLGGNKWDDGCDYDDVTKIQILGNFRGMEYIEFEYIKNGQTKVGPIHGLEGKGFKETFEINHLEKEYLISVEGYYDEQSGIIQGLQFKTNLKTSELIGDDEGKKFTLGSSGYKIVGFHGFAAKNLNSLGAYLVAIPCITKLEQQGGDVANTWDDGSYDGVRNVYVGYDDTYVKRVRFDYVYNGKVKKRQHGFKGGQEGQFEIDYPNELITSVEGTYLTYNQNPISSLIFKTSKGRTSPIFGKMPHGNFEHFVLENKGCGLVGFHGRTTSHVLYALGAYSSPLPLFPVAEKLEAEGVNGGDPWDDGSFDGLRKIFIGFCGIGIAFVKFVYDKDHHLVFGDDHGTNTVLGVEEFMLDYPSEYMISIDGSYEKIPENGCEVITMLKFKTNLKPCTVFGMDKASTFEIGKEGHKIVGFHGKSSNMLHQIGVYVLPINE